MSRRTRIVGVIVAAAILGRIVWSLLKPENPPIFYVPSGAVPPPVVVTLARSNAPVRVFQGLMSVFLILPDGSLWEWGQPGGGLAKAAVPRRVGTNDGWVQGAAADGHYLAIRNDGTLWNW